MSDDGRSLKKVEMDAETSLMVRYHSEMEEEYCRQLSLHHGNLKEMNKALDAWAEEWTSQNGGK